MIDDDHRDRPAAAGWVGPGLLIGSAVAFSTAGLFTRAIDQDIGTMLFWRGLFGSVALLAFLVWREGRKAAASLKLTPAGWLVALFFTGSTILFVAALRLTTVAEVTVIFAATPFLAALLGALVLQRLGRSSTLIAAAAALAGVGVAVWPSFGQGTLAGALAALASATLAAGAMLALQLNPRASFLPAACVTGVLCVLLFAPFVDQSVPAFGELVALAAFGTVQLALGMMLLILGSQRVPAVRAALIGTLETPLAPLLVWMAFAEPMSLWTFAGGSIVLAAVAADILTARGHTVT